MKNKTYYVQGMKCASCEIIIGDAIQENGTTKNHRVDSSRNEIYIETIDDQQFDSNRFLSSLNHKLKNHGYTVSEQPGTPADRWRNLAVGVLIATALLALYYASQKLGVENLIPTGGFQYLTAFVIGLVASVSSCLAVVGGLVLSLSSHYARATNGSWKPQIGFHLGRIGGFFVLGGMLGSIGSFFQLSYSTHAILIIITSLIMVLVGLQLIDGFKLAPKLSLSAVFLKLAMKYAQTTGNILIPFIIGWITFFLPCGFTQSMQLLALQSGSFVAGAIIMSLFALGTLPTLLVISYTSVRFSRSRFAPIFFNTAAIIIIILGLQGVINSLKILNLL